ncbi:hypothetical protein GCM10023172_09290 [Hymenobacter ginsengisoli]|uniref:DUF3592 domain-containing protein n=1 Tax=Hymenobacter ginsengisoli TaxID=1051626 RepID=A0ABP8Q0V7_9BACT|nr:MULTISPECIES: DUF3592 domain-containing protein [unclassified Hymenobacter]MBO2032497.1 DUF3592 domain-containing protein [Hymenobacter sp. BT559]
MLDISAGIPTAFSVGIGSVFLYSAFERYRKRTFLLQNGLRTESTVVRLEQDDDPDSSSLYPVVRFTDSSYETITLRYNSGSYPAAFHLGQRVQILYDPSKPQDFVIGYTTIDWETINVLVIGISLVGVGLYCCIKPYL